MGVKINYGEYFILSYITLNPYASLSLEIEPYTNGLNSRFTVSLLGYNLIPII